MSNLDMEKDIRETVDYLYKIEGECPPELYKAIDRLRQLINEEFVGKNKTVSSQLIYAIVNPAITALIQEARDEGYMKGIKDEVECKVTFPHDHPHLKYEQSNSGGSNNGV